MGRFNKEVVEMETVESGNVITKELIKSLDPATLVALSDLVKQQISQLPNARPRKRYICPVSGVTLVAPSGLTIYVSESQVGAIGEGWMPMAESSEPLRRARKKDDDDGGGSDGVAPVE